MLQSFTQKGHKDTFQKTKTKDQIDQKNDQIDQN